MQGGTVRSQVQLQMLTSKWEQKKQVYSNVETKKQEMTQEERLMEQLKSDFEANKKASKTTEITNKIQSGATLTSEEIAYLKEHNPTALQQYEEIRREEKSYKNQLKNCKTKEEVERLKTEKVGAYLSQVKTISNNPHIPKAQKVALLGNLMAKVNVISQAHEEFSHSMRFKNLPTEAEERENHSEKVTIESNTIEENLGEAILEESSQPQEEVTCSIEEATKVQEGFEQVEQAIYEGIQKEDNFKRRVDINI